MKHLLYIPTKNEVTKHYQAVIEVPAGTNHKTEINKITGAFETSLRNGQKRIIDFLGYPLNYGFVPSTIMDKKQGGDDDPIDALLICESVPMGSVIDFLPIAVLRLKDNHELDSKIIGIPVNLSLRTIQSTTFSTFKKNYPAILDILVLWFLNYDKRNDTTEFINWEDEKAAIDEIEKWRIRS